MAKFLVEVPDHQIEAVLKALSIPVNSMPDRLVPPDVAEAFNEEKARRFWGVPTEKEKAALEAAGYLTGDPKRDRANMLKRRNGAQPS